MQNPTVTKLLAIVAFAAALAFASPDRAAAIDDPSPPAQCVSNCATSSVAVSVRDRDPQVAVVATVRRDGYRYGRQVLHLQRMMYGRWVSIDKVRGNASGNVVFLVGRASDKANDYRVRYMGDAGTVAADSAVFHLPTK